MPRHRHSLDFDIVIVGGGFAGLVCARTAAMRGLRVALLDRKPEPGAWVHTSGILVKEAADELDVPAALTRKVRRVRLYGPAMRAIELSSPGYYFLATETAGLLRWLADQASAAGAALHYGTPFRGARHLDHGLHVDGLDATARYLIGADGATSKVARSFGLGRNSRFLIGVEVEFPGHGALDPGSLHCFVDRRLAPGYIAWAIPGVGITQVGLACPLPAKPRIEALANKIAGVTGFAEEPPLGRRHGLIPVGGLARPFATQNVLLVGDAAGLVSPMTAGGIHNAFHFGRRAAQVVSDHLLDRGPEPSRVLAAEYPRYPLKSLMRRLIEWGPPDWAVDLALDSWVLRLIAQQIYFHRRHSALGPARGRDFKPLRDRQWSIRVV